MIVLVGGKAWKKSAASICMAENVFIVENGSSLFKRRAAGF